MKFGETSMKIVTLIVASLLANGAQADLGKWRLTKNDNIAEEGVYNYNSYFTLTPPDRRPPITIAEDIAKRIRNNDLQPEAAYAGNLTAGKSESSGEFDYDTKNNGYQAVNQEEQRQNSDMQKSEGSSNYQASNTNVGSTLLPRQASGPSHGREVAAASGTGGGGTSATGGGSSASNGTSSAGMDNVSYPSGSGAIVGQNNASGNAVGVAQTSDGYSSVNNVPTGIILSGNSPVANGSQALYEAHQVLDSGLNNQANNQQFAQDAENQGYIKCSFGGASYYVAKGCQCGASCDVPLPENYKIPE